MIKFIYGFIAGFYICLFIIACMSPYNYMSQVQCSIKHELSKKSNKIFFLKDSDIQLTKRADGSAILRIKEE